MDNYFDTNIFQICRTCMKEITDASVYNLDLTPLANTQLTIKQTLYNCIPELDLSIVSNAVICTKCLDNLLSVYEFKQNCLQSEIHINKYIQQVQHTGDLNLVEVLLFHQPDIKNLGIDVKKEDLDMEVKIEDLEIPEDFKNRDLVSDASTFNEASECTESTEPKYLLKLEEVNMQYALVNTYDDYNINYNLSATEENSDTPNSNIAQNCLPEVIKHQDNYSKNLNKTNAYQLRQHTTIHAGEKQFSCSICKYQCSRKSHFNRHILIHTGEKPFSCSVCKYQCNQKSRLKQHMQIHTGEKEEKPFSCCICEYQCSQKSKLKQHVLIHKKDKPFSCYICEYQCCRKNKLKQHILIHTGEKPFICCVCQYRCNSKSNLNKHMRIHTGEKPFSCSICEYQCSQKSNLKRHMRIHTG